METLWLTKLILAHLLTDFIFQPKKWVEDRMQKHFASGYLYIHTIITALVAWAFIGWKFWPVALTILITHTIIDGWKSYQKPEARYFLADQVLHLVVIVVCWCFVFYDLGDLKSWWHDFTGNSSLLIYITAFTFLSFPCAILIGQLTSTWRNKLGKAKAEAGGLYPSGCLVLPLMDTLLMRTVIPLEVHIGLIIHNYCLLFSYEGLLERLVCNDKLLISIKLSQLLILEGMLNYFS